MLRLRLKQKEISKKKKKKKKKNKDVGNGSPKGKEKLTKTIKEESVRKLGEDIVNQMVKEKILNHRGMVEPAKEKECLKCKEWERLDLERRRLQEQQRQNEILGGGYPDRNDPFSSRGPPSFPRQPLHPGMGPRIGLHRAARYSGFRKKLLSSANRFERKREKDFKARKKMLSQCISKKLL